jgi:adenylate cyclase
MSTERVVTLVIVGVAALELIAIVVLSVLLARSRLRNARLQKRVTAPRPGPRSAAGRAVKAVVETAARVRTQGVGGLVMASLEDLTRWVTEDRAEIARVAAPDGTVTIMFSDIEDSTAITEELGDARWVRLLEAHDALVRAQIARHRGHVVKSQGDGFMVVFGAPADAVHAATNIQRELTTGTGRRLRRTPLRVRIGIHVGPAISRDNDYFGRNVAMAARVAAQAGGGEIVVSDEVRTALDDDEFTLHPAGEVELKGLADVHALWTVDWAG